jgi:hypothetical protein
MNSETSQTFTWVNSFTKSIEDNSQLIFSKKMSISSVNKDDNLPISEILDLQEIKTLENFNNSSLVFFLDNRTIFFNSLKSSSLVHLVNYFPLSREKYKMNCLAYIISGNDEITSKTKNILQVGNYFKINFKYNNIDEDNLLHENFISKIYEEINTNNHKEVLNKYWTKLSCEEKLEYESVDKDSIKNNSLINKQQNEDLDKFDCQEEILFSKNFSVLFLVPLDVEHCIYPMPQVVANSRRPNFESLMKPHKKPKKYFFILNVLNGNWNFKELNI